MAGSVPVDIMNKELSGRRNRLPDSCLSLSPRVHLLWECHDHEHHEVETIPLIKSPPAKD